MSYVDFVAPALEHAQLAADHDEKQEYDKGTFCFAGATLHGKECVCSARPCLLRGTCSPQTRLAGNGKWDGVGASQKRGQAGDRAHTKELP